MVLLREEQRKLAMCCYLVMGRLKGRLIGLVVQGRFMILGDIMLQMRLKMFRFVVHVQGRANRLLLNGAFSTLWKVNI